MLILKRREMESVMIGDDIIITVVQVEDGAVRLGISAPIEVEVDRSEVRERKRREGYRRPRP